MRAVSFVWIRERIGKAEQEFAPSADDEGLSEMRKATGAPL
jgi:hypothetical protein